MMRKKSFFKKLVVVIAFFILILVLSCARKKSENQNQSESLNNQILQALGYIENGEFNYAEKLLQEVKAKDPENCEASYGLALIYLRNLVEIVNSVSVKARVWKFNMTIQILVNQFCTIMK
jgi:Tfp pilus assembly protein PilF